MPFFGRSADKSVRREDAASLTLNGRAQNFEAITRLVEVRCDLARKRLR